MLLVSDVHGAWEYLRAVAERGETLLVLGDLVNLVDYRTMDGVLADVFGKPMVARVAALRAAGDHAAARQTWREAAAGREDEIRDGIRSRVAESYRRTAEALGDCPAYVTYGNVDDPAALRDSLPQTARFVDGDVVEIEGLVVGFAGGAIGPDLGAPGIVSEDEMAAKLASLGDVDVLCTHAAPAVRELSSDVVGGDAKQSEAVLSHIREHRPRFHYFGDIHQPKALAWRVGPTLCRNVGYFRATGRPVRHV